MLLLLLWKHDRVVLAVTAVFEQYVELFVSWFPFYYLFKCMFLGLLLVPNTKVRRLIYELPAAT